ncbi:hypothetical protein [Aquabacter spiritensis]|uniref:Uncharacterized protein n=1 Tax=Aquabacter spiritensis TaxID=933073 RepID=A0A4R3M098_9HYPH|nr:hypothetical protein [Aquabacter spiritensis]TCT06006.1 hypothetical protein EDC64_103107 [Aquabacter spiritensis]
MTTSMRITFERCGAWRRRVMAVPAAGLIGVLTLALAGGVARAEDGDTGDGAFMQNVLSAIGLVGDAQPNIQYRERAPLVVPPPHVAATLPPPKSSAAATNPNWPKDPDVLRARAAAAEDRSPVGLNDIEVRGRALMPSQLNNVRHKPTASVTSGAPVGADARARDELMPSELGFFGWTKGLNGAFSDKPLTFTGEPVRESLVEPPPGYQTPAPNAPYGVVEKKEETFKFPSLFDLQNQTLN